MNVILRQLYCLAAAAVLSVASLTAKAQTGVGNWVIHPVFAGNITNIVDTGDLVYYLSDGNLFYYDKKAEENHFLSRNNKLNDVSVRQIYYNYDARYLMVVYESSNIDVIYPDGSVTNVPDIAHADIDPKGINHITFSGSKVMVATDFGFAILNADKDFEVTESQNFGVKTTSITQVSDFLIISNDNGAYSSPKSLAMHSLSTFTKFHTYPGSKFYNINDTTILMDEGWIYRCVFDSTGMKSKKVAAEVSLRNIAATSTGFIGTSLYEPNKMVTIDREGITGTIHDLPEEMSKSIVTTAESDGSIWELSAKGVRHLTVENGEVATVMADYFKYNSSTVKYPYYLVFNEALGRLYVTDCGPNLYATNYIDPAHHQALLLLNRCLSVKRPKICRITLSHWNSFDSHAPD